MKYLATTLLSAFVSAADLMSPLVSATDFLKVEGDHFTLRGSQVFLSGGNQAWIDYGNDFGNGQSYSKRCDLQKYIKDTADAGGNSIRIWLFTEGQSIPQWDAAGEVSGTDGENTLVDDLKVYLDYAASQNVYITLCLWNGALMRKQETQDLFFNSDKLKAFIYYALDPVVRGLKEYPALASYEIINEPEGVVKIASDSEPCFDTMRVLNNSGAGWAGAKVSMEQMLKFINWQAAIIHDIDPKALVTVGSWATYASTDVVMEEGREFFNYYKDECLIKAGAIANGTLDYNQVHNYWTTPGQPFQSSASDYSLGKPLVIGEFSSQKSSATKSISLEYEYALAHGYSGVWDWAFKGGDGNDDLSIAVEGMAALKGNNLVKVDILNGSRPAEDTCGKVCSDEAPDGNYTCVQQAGWGKCSQSWMKGYCCMSCHGCNGCQ